MRLGEVIALPLEDGRFGIVHVVALDGRHVGAVMASHVGAKPAGLADAPVKPHLREPSISRTGLLDGPLVVATRWVSSPLPRGAVRLGVRPPTATDARLAITAYAGGWDNLAGTILMRWLRAHDPPGAAALLARWRGETAASARKHARKEKARAGGLTLARLARGKPLPGWSKRFPAAVVARARTILRDVARELARLDGRGKAAALRRAVERFNALDGTGGLRILTTEREDLCAAFVDLARAAKMRTAPDPTERWRDW